MCYSGKGIPSNGWGKIDFAGSYLQDDWKDIPGEMQEKAWKAGLIDATWHCTETCHATVTNGDVKKRMIRARAQGGNQIVTVISVIERLSSSRFPYPKTYFMQDAKIHL